MNLGFQLGQAGVLGFGFGFDNASVEYVVSQSDQQEDSPTRPCRALPPALSLLNPFPILMDPALGQVLEQDSELKGLKTKMATIEEMMKQAAEASQSGRKALEQVSGGRDRGNGRLERLNVAPRKIVRLGPGRDVFRCMTIPSGAVY